MMNFDEVIKEYVLTQLNKRYRYIEDIAKGDFTYVYLLEYTTDAGKGEAPKIEKRALKVLNAEQILKKIEKEYGRESKNQYEKIKERFLYEAKIYKKIDHPGIIKIDKVDVIKHSVLGLEIPFMIMNYIPGQDLKTFLKRNHPTPLPQIISIIKNILDALTAIHQRGIFHRDIRPEHVMVDENQQAILIGFILAKDLIRDTKLTSTGNVLGLPHYIAPEQFIDSSKIGPCSDIYSLGIIMYEMLTGQLPFPGNNVIDIMSAHCNTPVPDMKTKGAVIPLKLEKIVKKALEKDREKRFSCAEDMRKELIKFESEH